MDHSHAARQPRKPYERPAVARVVIDPVKEMLTDCTSSPNKTSPSYDQFGQCVSTCCTALS